MLDNKKLFFECLENPVKNVDTVAREILNKVVLPLEDDKTTELINKNYNLVELITSYNNYNVKGDNSHNTEILKEIDQTLKFEGMNFCPFSQYLMVHDVTYDMYLNKLTNEEKEYIINCFLNDRHQIYLNRDYSDIIFQVLTDNYSHKRKGSLGVEKIKKLLIKFNIDRITSEEDITMNTYYILPDAGDNKLFNKIIELNRIHFDFRNNHQGKMPDALIKINNSFFIVEHKILKELGGGQDKQMTEIIDFVGYDERLINYVSFMDGILFNELINPKTSNKLYRDKVNIINNLDKCKFNYFVNEYGFNKLIKNAMKNRMIVK